MASKIRELCKVFLKDELNIELSVEKTRITNVTKDYVRFLGVDIMRNISAESKIVKRNVKGRYIKSRINSTRLYFYMPVLHIMKKLHEAGFTKLYISQTGVKKTVPNAITK